MNQELRKLEALLVAQREQELREQIEGSTRKEERFNRTCVFRQLIRNVWNKRFVRGQKKNMEVSMIDFLKICQQKEIYCIHNNVDDLIESSLNSKLLSINLNSQHLNKEEHEVKNITEPTAKRQTRITSCLQNFKIISKESTIPLNKTPQISLVNAITHVLPTEEPEYSLIMRNEELSTILEKESDEFIKSSVEDLITSQESTEGYFRRDSVVLENIKSKESYVSNLDEPALLVTPLSDANEDECFNPEGVIDEIDAFLDMDIPTDIENDYHDSEGDIKIHQDHEDPCLFSILQSSGL
ncbi:hypothetical protein Tco_0533166 [Tanacetum coccineum]